jgi:tripartite-type tricarboxylate transporter receptor subunit TctC
MLQRRTMLLGGGAAIFGAQQAALAQNRFPTKPIHLVVGYSPGGGNDLIARIVATALQSKLAQPILVENKPGAQSIVAAELVAKAAPDGYTLLVAPSGLLTINPAVYAKLPYDPTKDFAPITLLAEFPLLLVVGAEQPIKTLGELIEYGRSHPDLANYASSATPFQLAAELLNLSTDSKFQHIPFRGSGDAAQAIQSGQVLMGFVDPGPITGLLKAGRLRALGITTARRPPDFPDVPTMAEVGIRDMEIVLWTGLVAPAGTPSDILMLLQDALSEALEMPSVETAMDAILVDPRATSPKEFAEIIVRDAARWKEVAAKANIKME